MNLIESLKDISFLRKASIVIHLDTIVKNCSIYAWRIRTPSSSHLAIYFTFTMSKNKNFHLEDVPQVKESGTLR